MENRFERLSRGYSVVHRLQKYAAMARRSDTPPKIEHGLMLTDKKAWILRQDFMQYWMPVVALLATGIPVVGTIKIFDPKNAFFNNLEPNMDNGSTVAFCPGFNADKMGVKTMSVLDVLDLVAITEDRNSAGLRDRTYSGLPELSSVPLGASKVSIQDHFEMDSDLYWATTTIETISGKFLDILRIAMIEHIVLVGDSRRHEPFIGRLKYASGVEAMLIGDGRINARNRREGVEGAFYFEDQTGKIHYTGGLYSSQFIYIG